MKFSFLWKYIYREILHQKIYSLQVVLSVAIGVGGVIGINSYRTNLKNTIEKEAKSIMGADLVAQSGSTFTKEDIEFIKKEMPLESEFEFSVNFPSMIYSPYKQETTLSLVKALGNQYPFYGEIVTQPENAYSQLKEDQILLDEGIAKNLKLSLGEAIQLGNKTFYYSGKIIKEPGVSGGFMAMAPTSIIKLSSLKETGLEARGSRINYNLLIKTKENLDTNKIKEEKFPILIQKNITLYHSTEVGSGSQKFIHTTLDYMSLLGLSAFFLGSIAIFLSCRTRVKNKSKEISVLKCIGSSSSFYILVFIGELIVFSLLGFIFGILTSYYFQFLIPDLAGSDLLHKIKPSLQPISIVWGLLVGLVVPILSGLESVYKIKKLSPLNAIRTELNSNTQIRFIPEITTVLEVALIFLAFGLIASNETKSFTKGFLLSLSLLLLPFLIFIIYNLLRFFIGFLLQAFASGNILRFSLRKINKTGSGLSLPIIGISSSLSILMLSIVLKQNLLEMGGGREVIKRPNVFVLDLKKDQVKTFERILEKYNTELKIVAPVINARLQSINQKQLQKQSTEKEAIKRDWRSTALVREYFLSYRKSIYDSEKLIEGNFWNKEGEAEISVEKDFATSLGVGIGDSLEFNVQGIVISGKITNIRSVNWSDMKPNFVVLFSPGVLEQAPGYNISSFYISDSNQRYEFQKELVVSCPNATVIDIEKSVQNFLGIIDKVTDIINLMSSMVAFSSILLLFSSVYTNRFYRVKETVLFRIIGADSNFVYRIYLYEGLFIAIFSFFISLLLSGISNHIISTQVLNIQYRIPYLSLFQISFIVPTIILFVYILDVRYVLLNRSIRTLAKEG